MARTNTNMGSTSTVTRLLAGSGISLSPSGGTGDVTITETGGGGGTIGGSIAATEIAYGSGSNTITGDSNATRIIGTLTNISDSFSGGITSAIQLNPNFLGFGVAGAGLLQSASDGAAILAVGNFTGIGQSDFTASIISRVSNSNNATVLVNGAGSTGGIQMSYNDTNSIKPYLSLSDSGAILGFDNNSHTSGISAGNNTLQFMNNGHTDTYPTIRTAGALTNDGSGNMSWQTTAGAVGGTNMSIQYNNAGALGGGSGLTWDFTNAVFNAGDVTRNNLTSDAAVGTTVLLNNAGNLLVSTNPGTGDLLSVNNQAGSGAFFTAGALGYGNQTTLQINDSSQSITGSTTGTVNWGDTALLGHSTTYLLNDMTQSQTFTANNGFIFADSSGNEVANINPAGFFVSLGDVDAVENSTIFAISDGSKIINAQTTGQVFLGDSAGTGNKTNTSIDDSLQTITNNAITLLWSYNGNNVMSLDASNFSANIGDLNSVGSKTLFALSDTSATIQSKADNGTFISDTAGNLIASFLPNAGAPSFEVGDEANLSNGLRFVLSNTSSLVSLISEYNSVFDSNVFLSRYLPGGSVGKTSIGDLSNALHSTTWVLNDVLQTITSHGTIVESAIDSTTYGGTLNYASGFVGKARAYFSGSHSGTASGILLPTGTNAVIGTKFTVDDLGGLATTDPITVDAGTGNTITSTSGTAQTFVLNSNGESVSIIKLTSTQWMVE